MRVREREVALSCRYHSKLHLCPPNTVLMKTTLFFVQIFFSSSEACIHFMLNFKSNRREKNSS